MPIIRSGSCLWWIGPTVRIWRGIRTFWIHGIIVTGIKRRMGAMHFRINTGRILIILVTNGMVLTIILKA